MPRKGENIYKRKDGRWEARYIKSYDANHQAKYGYIYAHTYTDAKHKLSEVKSSIVTQSTITKDSKEFEYFCVLWLKEMQAQIKQSTYVKYYNIVNNHIIPKLGKAFVIDITDILVREFIDDKLLNGKINGDGGLSVKTVKDIISVLKLILQYTQNGGVETFCHFDNIKIKNQTKNISVLTENEQNIFTSYLMTDMDNTKLGILISLYSGLRIGEVCALKFEDISDGVIHVNRTMQRIQTLYNDLRKTEVIITAPKSACSVREVPLPQFLNELINKFYIPKAYILTGDTEAYIEPRTLQNRFKAHATKCGLHDINYHVTRHTYATMCVELGFDIKSLSEILGHSSVNITLNRYVHSSMALKKQNVEKLQKKINYLPS